jgi:hypothetical protein
MTPPRVIALALIVSGVLAGPAPLPAQPKAPRTASEFYLQYRKAFDAATKVDDLLPYMSAERRKEIEETPPKERAAMFEFVKTIGAVKNLKIIGETRGDKGATLTVEAFDLDRNPATGTIAVVLENGHFRIAQESWRSKSVSRR